MSDPSRKPTILAVDDSPANIDVVKEVLSADYLVQAAVDGNAALSIVAKQKPDLILLDIIMPGVDGYDVCRQLKTNAASRDIPIIFLTVKDEDADEAHGLALGAVDYIVKPISPAILKERVKTHLTLRQVRQRLELQNEELLTAARLREDVDNIIRHDLKAPLSVIVGYPDLMMSAGNLTEEQVGYLKSIQESGYLMLSMVNMSLNLLKMERGQYELNPEPVDLVSVFRKLFREYQGLVSREHLKLEMTLHGNPVGEQSRIFLRAEELLTFSLFSNLLKNAVEASPANKTISIQVESDGDMTRISLKNEGSVPEAIRDRFFDKYVTAGKKFGTGLGTYSARLMAETLQGSIELDASDPRSTTIVVSLPSETSQVSESLPAVKS